MSEHRKVAGGGGIHICSCGAHVKNDDWSLHANTVRMTDAPQSYDFLRIGHSGATEGAVRDGDVVYERALDSAPEEWGGVDGGAAGQVG